MAKPKGNIAEIKKYIEKNPGLSLREYGRRLGRSDKGIGYIFHNHISLGFKLFQSQFNYGNGKPSLVHAVSPGDKYTICGYSYEDWGEIYGVVTCQKCLNIIKWGGYMAFKKALEIIRDNEITMPKELARLLWPDSEGWQVSHKLSRGSSKGAGMALSAGGLLGRLRQRGLVGNHYPVILTDKGRDYIQEQ